MNIRRGLFRLWVVASGIWVLSIGSITYNEITSTYVSSRGVYFKRQLATPNTGGTTGQQAAFIYDPSPTLIELYTDAHREFEGYVAKGVFKKAPLKEYPTVLLYVPGDVDPSEMARQVKKATEIVRSVNAVVAAKKRPQAIRTGIIEALWPPVAVFVFGWLTLWIARGFRGKNQTPEQ